MGGSCRHGRLIEAGRWGHSKTEAATMLMLSFSHVDAGDQAWLVGCYLAVLSGLGGISSFSRLVQAMCSCPTVCFAACLRSNEFAIKFTRHQWLQLILCCTGANCKPVPVTEVQLGIAS